MFTTNISIWEIFTTKQSIRVIFTTNREIMVIFTTDQAIRVSKLFNKGNLDHQPINKGNLYHQTIYLLAWLRERRSRGIVHVGCRLVRGWGVLCGTGKLGHSGCRGRMLPGLGLRRHGSFSYFASPLGQLYECSQSGRFTGVRCVAKPLGQRQGLTTGESQCCMLTGISWGSL